MGQSWAIFWLFLLYFYFCESESIQIFTINSLRAIKPYDIVLNYHIHIMLADSGTPLQFYCGHQGTAVDLWSCLKKWGSVCFNFLIRELLRPQIAVQWHANILCVIIHIGIVLNNAKYLINWSNFVVFEISRYQHNPTIISYAFIHFLCM